MTDPAPDWLLEMRAITGLSEKPGAADEPKIMAMAEYIGRTFPDMASYCALYTHDAIPWCGLCAAYTMARAGIRPPFGPTDTDKFLWAQAWGDDAVFGTVLGEPRPGCVAVMTRSGGGHVTLFEEDAGDSIRCRGGNQADSVNVASFPKSNVIAYVWPREAGPAPPAARRTLLIGDKGEDVAALQTVLGIPADGDFGAVTDTQVEAFQAASSIEVDGVVGPVTWAEVDKLAQRLATGSEGLSDGLAAAIVKLAEGSDLAVYSWPDRGRSPPGYLPGMCLVFAVVYLSFTEGESSTAVMARPLGGDDTDALKWCEEELDEVGAELGDPEGRLRALFTLLLGLGMRESSGNYSCGRDTSAGSSSQSSETCEAGLFQTSWNASNASPEFDKLLNEYWNDPNGYLDVFAEGITPTASNLACVGKGDGVRYQFLAKFCPLFAAQTTAVGLRVLRKHWGPVNRHEVTIEPSALDLLWEVQLLVDGAEPVPEPPQPDKPATVSIATTGDVTLVVNGVVID